MCTQGLVTSVLPEGTLLPQRLPLLVHHHTDVQLSIPTHQQWNGNVNSGMRLDTAIGISLSS